MKTTSRFSEVVRASPGHSPGKRGQVGKHTGGSGAPRVPFALLVTALAVGGLSLLLVLNTASAANEVRRHDLTARDASIAAKVQELENEVAASAAPGNLARAAAALGMVPAANPAFLVIGANGAVQVMGSAAPASEVHLAQQPKKKKKKSTTAASKTATGTTHSTTSSTSSSTSAAKTTPAPTPTPTITLPGGNR